jgi:hypothetical protein
MAPNGEWDIFGWELGLGLPISWFGVDSIISLLDSTTTSYIDQLVVGWDGKEEVCLDVVKRLLVARGYFWGLDYQGRIIFSRLRMATIADLQSYTTITPIPRELWMTTGASEGVDKMRVLIGELPWADGVEIEVNALGDSDALNPPNSIRAGLFAADREVELDLSVMSVGLGDRTNPLELISRLEFRAFGAPIIRFRANDPGTISHGDFLKIGDPGLETSWFVDGDTGDPIEVDTGARWFGQVVEFKRNFADGSIELGLLLHNWHLNDVARLRGPSAIVASVASNVYTCDANAFKYVGGSDVGAFSVGDKVEVFDEGGVLVSGTKASSDVQEITAIDTGASTITLDSAWTTPPSAGHIIRWARVYTGVGNSETTSALYANVLPYTAAAGADGKITPSDLDPHIYGFNSQ